MLAEPIILILFERGAFSANDSLQASYSLIALAFGLIAFMLIKILTPSFFARQEPKKPMYVALASMILNAVLAWFLGFHLGYGHIGLALASSISAFFTVVVLIYLLKSEDVYEASEGWGLFWIRLIFASAFLILFINYFGNALFIHSNAFLNGQETIFQTHFTIDLIILIIFFLLHLVKEIISVLCSPLLCIFYVPVVSLYLPIRHLVLHRKRWYVPNKSVVRLCCVVAII